MWFLRHDSPSVGWRHAAPWHLSVLVILGAALVASTLTVAGPAAPASAYPEPCGLPAYKNFYGAFYVWQAGCADHDISPAPHYDPFIQLELQSPQPWRFTDCTIHWAYKTALNGVVHRPPDVSCKDLVVEMASNNRTQAASSYNLGGRINNITYLELWGHTTVRFDHVDWNAPDFHYLCDDPRPTSCFI